MKTTGFGLEHALFHQDPRQPEVAVTWPLDQVAVVLYHEPGESVVSFQLDADREVEARAETIAHVLREREVPEGEGTAWELSRHVRRLDDPSDRAAAVRWAREQAATIVSGDLDEVPLSVFNAARRMEHVLTRWQWLDSDFPAPIAPFVWGWSVSGSDTEREIRRAAAILVADRSGDGPALRPHR